MAIASGGNHQKRQKRLGMTRLVFLLLFLLVAGGFLRLFFLSPNARTTWVVDEDPLVVGSWEEASGQLTRIEIPSETTVEAVGGYGRYPLRALWDLGSLEGKGGMILAASVEESLALPVPYYFKSADGALDSRSLFSFSSWWDIVRNNIYTNMPMSTWFTLARRLAFLRPDRIKTVTLTEGLGVAARSAPDGSRQLVMDLSQVDVLVGALFEDEQVRHEAFPVAVYNTTTMPTLGTRVGRMLSRLGYLVVAVENDESPVENCEMRISSQIAKSASVNYLREVLGCDVRIDEGAKRADIVVRMGMLYARKFLPAQSP